MTSDNLPVRYNKSGTEIVKKAVSVWTMRGVGYALVGGVISGFADWKVVEDFLFGTDGMVSYESMATLAVGGIFIFIGEFMSNYLKSLKDQSFDRAKMIQEIGEIKKNLSNLDETVKESAKNMNLEIRRATDNENYATQGRM